MEANAQNFAEKLENLKKARGYTSEDLLDYLGLGTSKATSKKKTTLKKLRKKKAAPKKAAAKKAAPKKSWLS